MLHARPAAQGFFGPSTPERQADNPYAGSEGTDFVRNHGGDNIDFAVAHGARVGAAPGCIYATEPAQRCCARAVWADQWLRCDHDCQVAFIARWHQSHLEAAAALGACRAVAARGAACTTV